MKTIREQIDDRFKAHLYTNPETPTKLYLGYGSAIELEGELHEVMRMMGKPSTERKRSVYREMEVYIVDERAYVGVGV